MEQEVNALAKDVQKMNVAAKYTAKKLRLIADDLDGVWKDCKITSAFGNGAGIVGGLLTIFASSAFTPVAIAFGAAGACANLGANYLESSTNSSRIQEADRAVANANRAINDVRKRIRQLKDGKSNARLVFCATLAAKMLGWDHQVVAIIKSLLSSDLLLKFLSESTVQIASEVILKVGEATTSVVEKIGTKAGADRAGAFVAGVSVAFIILDTVELSFTVRDIVKNKGSHAARLLRCKAEEYEELQCA